MQTREKRFATITAYDYSFAKLFADEGIPVMMLVGDSLGMTIQGHDSTPALPWKISLTTLVRATWRA